MDFPGPPGFVVRLFGFRVRRIVAHASGCWSLDLSGGERVRVSLQHGWIAGAGRIVGMRWSTSDGRRIAVGLCCLHPDRSHWRRLLVRLRVPMSA